MITLEPDRIVDQADVIQQACWAAEAGQDATARELLRAHYPFQPIPKVKRTCSLRQSIAIFERDGFIDRYQGTRLVYPKAYETLDQAYQGLEQYFVFYNHQRPHQALSYRTPAEVYADRLTLLA